MSEAERPGEVYVVSDGSPRRLTHHMDAFLAPISLATVEGFQSKSSDGTMVSGLIYRPAGVTAGAKLPLILFIHGGPVSQDAFDFDLSRQILASGGFAVAAVNYRGVNGPGIPFCKSINAGWWIK